jgi:tryptophanyl-tRNA synthetase
MRAPEAPTPDYHRGAMTRVLSCIQPTGDVHLGNYLGALNPWVKNQHTVDGFYGIVDLHSLTAIHDPAVLRKNVVELATALFAIGLNPDAATVFVQSHVPEHTQLSWLMECTVSVGELQRMIQFKDKSAKAKGGFIPAGLLTYPALMVADILLYDANEVPVGDDQKQHVELTRDAAIRFNNRYGETFVVPKFVAPDAGARVMDLQDPTSKMSKSTESANGCVYLLDSPEVILRKFKRAVTDSDNEVRFDRETKPGVSNLLEILAACTGRKPADLASDYTQYGALKSAAGEAVIELLRPIQARFAELASDPGEVERLLGVGASKAQAVAGVTLDRAYRAAGLRPAR